MYYFEDLPIGREVVFEDEYRVTEDEIIEVGQRWDPRPMHIDPVAAVDSIFGGLVASSAHIFAIYVCIGNAVVDRDKQSAAVSALGFNHLQWRAPVRPNDVLRSAYTVVSARVSASRPACGVVTTKNRLFNQHEETVFTLECAYLIERRDIEA
ncbi:MAG: acyl dehydratase [Halioglobus sp.]|nr:acyl dehydratase [Halioglobus sp.]